MEKLLEYLKNKSVDDILNMYNVCEELNVDTDDAYYLLTELELLGFIRNIKPNGVKRKFQVFIIRRDLNEI